jgi:hypothetical protein
MLLSLTNSERTIAMMKSLLTVLVQSLLLTALVGIASANGAESEPESEPAPLLPLEVSYNASMEKGITLDGDARRRLQERDDGTWLYRTEVDSFIADIDESLVFRWDKGRVVPLRTAIACLDF